ncbi:MAG TPA: hypothetical protein VMG82_23720 [Candidatus Sulfotelmatobacter sp.]|nr:hypothetical protein [Candidatus Sulfotelmatobacter sp.]
MTADDTRQQKERSDDAASTQEKELAEVCARFADLCQYFSQQNMDLPTQIVDEVRSVSKLEVADRVARMKRLNQELMECLNGANPGPQVRQ